MRKALEISAYAIGGLSLIVLANQIRKTKNSGVGFLTSSRRMGIRVGKSDKGLNQPYTDKNIKQFLDFWKGLDKEYKTNWYKAVWESENGNDTPFFYVSNKKFKTKGGRIA